jgi:hypothetical protein
VSLRANFEKLGGTTSVLAALVGAAVIATTITATSVTVGGAGGPSFTSGTGAPASSAARGSVYLRTDTAAMYQNTDGATTWAQVGAASSSVIGTITQDASPWAASTNLTTEGTIDYADWNVTGQLGGYGWTSIHARPPSASPRAFRLFPALSWTPNGPNGSIATTAVYSGNGTSTTIGTDNYAVVALANSSTCQAYTTNANGGGFVLKFRLFPSEAAFTLKLYLVLVDSIHSYTASIIQDGAVSSSTTGTLTSTNGSTVLLRVTIPITPGTHRDSWFEFKTTRTGTPNNVNPRIYACGATMF